MTAFKIFAAVLVFCVTLNVAFTGTVPLNQPSHNVGKKMIIGNYGIAGCITEFPKAYALVAKAKVLLKEFLQLKTTVKIVKKKCNRLSKDRAKERCLKDVDEEVKPQIDEFLGKVKGYVYEAIEVAKKFKDCFIGK